MCRLKEIYAGKPEQVLLYRLLTYRSSAQMNTDPPTQRSYLEDLAIGRYSFYRTQTAGKIMSVYHLIDQ